MRPIAGHPFWGLTVFIHTVMALAAHATVDAKRLEFHLTGFDYRVLFMKPEYKDILRNYAARHFTDAEDLTPVMKSGKRFLDWLILINEKRDTNDKISLSSPDTQTGIPITNPIKSSDTIVLQMYKELKSSAPEWFKSVVFSNKPLTPTLTVSDEEFIRWGREIDFVYERASRWILQQPYLSAYAAAKSDDVRGYYFLSRDPNIETKLRDFFDLSSSEQAQLTGWLTSLCVSSGTKEQDCQKKLNEINSSHGDMENYYKSYFAGAKLKWDSFFALGAERTDITWSNADPLLMTLPFADPKRKDLEDFLSVNIEDEWRWQNWQLKLAFQTAVSGMAHLAFEAGATPHVDTLGGNEIVMDENAPLTEYDVQWTIRHEFGHVLGFPDCYVEFYDSKEKVMINYQLDVTNLMCSREGKLQQIHYDELKRHYYRN